MDDFVVPASGRVLVIITAQIFGSTGQTFGFMTVQLDGDITTANDANSLRVAGTDGGRSPGECDGDHHGSTAGAHDFCGVYRNQGSGTATLLGEKHHRAPGLAG